MTSLIYQKTGVTSSKERIGPYQEFRKRKKDRWLGKLDSEKAGRGNLQASGGETAHTVAVKENIIRC